MRLMEMVLALLAVVLFTTISLVYNRGMWSQAETLDNAAKAVQATQLAHSRLDEIDAKLFSKQIAFSNIRTLYTGTSTVNLSYAGYKFTVTYTPNYCDSLGVVTTVPNDLFVKVQMTVRATSGMKAPIRISRIYTKTNLNI